MRHLIKKNPDSLTSPSLFDRYFGGDLFSGLFDSAVPAVNVKEGKKKYTVEVSAPGFDKDDFSVEISGGMLKISASKELNEEEKDEDEKIIRQEFRSSSFSRSFTIPENVDPDKIAAKEKNGVLTLTLPKLDKAPEDSSKKVSIG